MIVTTESVPMTMRATAKGATGVREEDGVTDGDVQDGGTDGDLQVILDAARDARSMKTSACAKERV